MSQLSSRHLKIAFNEVATADVKVAEGDGGNRHLARRVPRGIPGLRGGHHQCAERPRTKHAFRDALHIPERRVWCLTQGQVAHVPSQPGVVAVQSLPNGFVGLSPIFFRRAGCS